MADKPIYIARISPNYTRCEVWHGEPETNVLLGRSIITPDKGLKRVQRYDVIARWLVERFGLRAAPYEAANTQRKARGANGRQ